MLIKNLFNKNRPVISFKIFPPKIDSPIETIYNTFDNIAFLNFYEKAKGYNISIPISAGIMPVINKNQINRITYLYGSSIPKKNSYESWRDMNIIQAL